MSYWQFCQLELGGEFFVVAVVADAIEIIIGSHASVRNGLERSYGRRVRSQSSDNLHRRNGTLQ